MKPTFIPMLYVGHNESAAALEFYQKAFGATVFRSFNNDDGTVHITELEIEGVMFRFHEDNSSKAELCPHAIGATTVGIDLRVDDPDALMEKVIAAGAKETSPMQDYFYGYRQGSVIDPFGHKWTFEKVI